MFKLSSAMRFGSVVAMTASVLPRSCPLQIRISDWCHDSWQLLLGVVAGTCSSVQRLQMSCPFMTHLECILMHFTCEQALIGMHAFVTHYMCIKLCLKCILEGSMRTHGGRKYSFHSCLVVYLPASSPALSHPSHTS